MVRQTRLVLSLCLKCVLVCPRPFHAFVSWRKLRNHAPLRSINPPVTRRGVLGVTSGLRPSGPPDISGYAPLRPRLVPLPAAIPSSDETGRYTWISCSAGFCRTGSGWPAGRTLQWARPQPTEPHVVRHTYNLRRHETVDLILNSRYLGHARLMITLPTELWSNNLENKLGYTDNRDFLHYIII